MPAKDHVKIEKSRIEIAAKLRELRVERRWTQRELGEKLGLSQSRLSEIENGSGSLTAEQFVHALRLFNAGLTDFVAIEDRRDAALQNALARFGAKHLVESETLVSGALDDLANLVREGLVRGVPRFVTALAPVLVVNVERLDLGYINAPLASGGFGRRLPWLVDNLVEAIRMDSADALERTWASRYRRTELLLRNYLELARTGTAISPTDRVPWDILDPDVRSPQSEHLLIHRSSSISRRWRIASSLLPEDFNSALREARSNA